LGNFCPKKEEIMGAKENVQVEQVQAGSFWGMLANMFTSLSGAVFQTKQKISLVLDKLKPMKGLRVMNVIARLYYTILGCLSRSISFSFFFFPF
jgi:hypothetical protein